MQSENFDIKGCPNCGAKNRVTNIPDKLPVCGKCSTPLSAASKTAFTVTDSNFDQIVTRSNLPVLLDCWAPWCAPCRTVGPIIDELASEYGSKINFGKLNVDENQQIAGRYNIQSIPTLLVFVGGKIVDRIVGAQPKQLLEGKLQKYL